MALKKVVNETEFVDSEEKSDIVLLDVCCGTGTIGLCMAKQVQKVIGIDICKEAIEDAIMNAKLNSKLQSCIVSRVPTLRMLDNTTTVVLLHTIHNLQLILIYQCRADYCLLFNYKHMS